MRGLNSEEKDLLQTRIENAIRDCRSSIRDLQERIKFWQSIEIVNRDTKPNCADASEYNKDLVLSLLQLAKANPFCNNIMFVENSDEKDLAQTTIENTIRDYRDSIHYLQERIKFLQYIKEKGLN